MKSWSGIRKTLEQDRLAPSLQGRVRYLATRYRGAHDDMGRIALLIDDQDVAQAEMLGGVDVGVLDEFDQLFHRYSPP